MKNQPDDQSIKVCVLKNLGSLLVFETQFNRAVTLFDWLKHTDFPLDGLESENFAYRMIAARDGALSVFHFKCCLEAIKKQLPRSKSLSVLVDTVKIRETLKRFSVLFPHSDNVRHGIAHAGELLSSPERMKQNGMKVSRYGPGFAVHEGGYLLAALHDRTYSVGNLGEVFSLTLDHVAISNLRTVRSSVEEALHPLMKRHRQPAEPTKHTP
jgi:hypothetical protein